MENQTAMQPAGEQGVNRNGGDGARGGASGQYATIYNPANPSILTETQLREIDSELQPFTAADVRLHGIFGDTCHQNDGSHMHGRGCPEKDKKMQQLHRRISSVSKKLWDLPTGAVADRFLKLCTCLWRDTRHGICNLEIPLIFPACILHKRQGKRYSYKETKQIFLERMNA